jgi:hypothetical protein
VEGFLSWVFWKEPVSTQAKKNGKDNPAEGVI